jgi:cation diffusion facilitator family transporter
MSPARRTALTSVCAAIVLVAAKLVVGLASGSLGILAEAAHSAADAGAALLTFYAVTVAERPADQEHPYGHGKAQHLSALAEAAVLATLALVVAFEGFRQLGSGNSSVDPTWYAFALMFGVLGVDAARASISLREGRASRSPALLANAWHFASDFAGTLAVLIGLFAAAAGAKGGDAIAAIFVATLVLAAAVRLAVRNVNASAYRALRASSAATTRWTPSSRSSSAPSARPWSRSTSSQPPGASVPTSASPRRPCGFRA